MKKQQHSNTKPTKKTAKNYYSLPQGYVIDPLVEFERSDRTLWATDDISKDILSYVEDLSLTTEGDLTQSLPDMAREIRRNNVSYIVNGLILAKIKFWRLYKRTHSCFDTYCKETFGITGWQASYDINSARVGLTLLTNGFRAEEIPQKKTQCIPLHRYAGLELVEKWRSLLQRFKPWKLKTTIIENFLHPKPLAKTIDTRIDVVDPVIRNVIDQLALYEKLSVDQLIKYLLYTYYKNVNFDFKSVNSDSKIEPVDPKKMAIWLEDLSELVSQHQQNDWDFEDLS
ncbi:MAG: hypothetical protein QNJ54_27880 [Prochloraceae cyanobacterium]|nr:hypothetical protein [Prochloraceae cyanobacterium]